MKRIIIHRQQCTRPERCGCKEVGEYCEIRLEELRADRQDAKAVERRQSASYLSTEIDRRLRELGKGYRTIDRELGIFRGATGDLASGRAGVKSKYAAVVATHLGIDLQAMGG